MSLVVQTVDILKHKHPHGGLATPPLCICAPDPCFLCRSFLFLVLSVAQVRPKFLEIGEKVAAGQGFTADAYFIGKVVLGELCWRKAFYYFVF